MILKEPCCLAVPQLSTMLREYSVKCWCQPLHRVHAIVCWVAAACASQVTSLCSGSAFMLLYSACNHAFISWLCFVQDTSLWHCLMMFAVQAWPKTDPMMTAKPRVIHLQAETLVRDSDMLRHKLHTCKWTSSICREHISWGWHAPLYQQVRKLVLSESSAIFAATTIIRHNGIKALRAILGHDAESGSFRKMTYSGSSRSKNDKMLARDPFPSVKSLDAFNFQYQSSNCWYQSNEHPDWCVVDVSPSVQS